MKYSSHTPEERKDNLMSVVHFIKQLFIEGYWECRYRKIAAEKELLDPTGKWTGKLLVSNRFWCADPFLVQEKGKTYVFVELMDRYRSYGLLGYAEINNANTDAKVKILKDLGYHTSYPNVFKYRDQWYMIPETSANNSIELYKATRFPDKWEKVSDLIKGINAVDSTVFWHDNKLMMFIYQSYGDENKLSIGELHPEKQLVDNIRVCKEYHKKIGRPGGAILYTQTEEIRPTQYGVNRYGEKLVFKRFSFEPDTFIYEEKDELEIQASDFSDCSGFIGLHTYGRCSTIEIIDLYKKKFFVFRPFMLVLKRIRLFGFQ